MNFVLHILFLVVCSTAMSFPDDPADTPKYLDYSKQGNLVSVRIVMGEPIRIFVVGREEAKLDLSKLKLKVRRLDPYPGKILKMNQSTGFYTISEPIDLKQPLNLEVTADINDKSETLRFNIKK